MALQIQRNVGWRKAMFKRLMRLALCRKRDAMPTACTGPGAVAEDATTPTAAIAVVISVPAIVKKSEN
jgi:hypothetical protein